MGEKAGSDLPQVTWRGARAVATVDSSHHLSFRGAWPQWLPAPLSLLLPRTCFLGPLQTRRQLQAVSYSLSLKQADYTHTVSGTGLPSSDMQGHCSHACSRVCTPKTQPHLEFRTHGSRPGSTFY